MSETSSARRNSSASAQDAFASLLPRRSAGLKLILVCGLALIMSIPATFVYSVAWERSSRADDATREVSQRFGGEQAVLGPVLAVPFSRTPDPEKPDTVLYGHAIAFAEEGDASAQVSVTRRKRGLYEVPVFETDITFDASFDPDQLRQAAPKDATVYWADARIYVGLSDNRGIVRPFEVNANGNPVQMEPLRGGGDTTNYSVAPSAGVRLAGGLIEGLSDMAKPLTVTAKMKFTGAGRLGVGPFAKDTKFRLTSDWPSPSFVGGAPPREYTKISDDSSEFEAAWSVPYLSRGVPGAGANLSLHDITAANRRDMAVRFVNEASPYQSVQRALKYAILFIGFVFLAYFLFELASGSRAHPAQYILVGLAQTIFYLLLLAFAERTGFDVAFAIAASLTVLLTSLYAASIFLSARFGAGALAVLTGIYGLSYVLMRAEDLALMGGAIASFIAIAATMWMTRNIDWYGAPKAMGGQTS